jgi:putative photosynthetic complex assembly protein 2
MPTPTTAAQVLPTAAAAPVWRTVGRAALRLILFWWLATGLIVATQRDALTRAIAAGIALAVAVFGLRLVWSTRDDVTPRGAQLAFIGGAFLWIFVQTAFYGGWIVGPELAIPASAGPSAWLAIHAIGATAWNEVASAAALAYCVTVYQRNPVAWLTVGTFWGTDQLAKLNVFLGVANPGTHFLPEQLYFLIAYFGPQRNSPLLPVSVVVLAGLAAWLFRRVLRDGHGFRREANALLAWLLTLAALEHLMLGLPVSLPLWDVFLQARGS